MDELYLHKYPIGYFSCSFFGERTGLSDLPVPEGLILAVDGNRAASRAFALGALRSFDCFLLYTFPSCVFTPCINYLLHINYVYTRRTVH